MSVESLILNEIQRAGLTCEKTQTGEDGLEGVVAGRWRVTEDNEEAGYFEGDEGTLKVIVVGSQEYGNERPSFQFTPDGYDMAVEVKPFESVEPV